MVFNILAKIDIFLKTYFRTYLIAATLLTLRILVPHYNFCYVYTLSFKPFYTVYKFERKKMVLISLFSNLLEYHHFICSIPSFMTCNIITIK